MDSPIAIGLDLSLTGAGVGFVGHNDDAPLDPVFKTYRFGRPGKRDEPLEMRLARIETIVDSIADAISGHMEWPRIAVIEAPATSAAGGSGHDRSALWWFTYKMLRQQGIPVVQVTTQKLKIYATGKGNKLDKEEVLIAMLRRHPEALIRNNDEADGLTLACMGARLLGQPVDGKLAQIYLRALDGVALP